MATQPQITLLSTGVVPAWFAAHKSVPVLPIYQAMTKSTQDMHSFPNCTTVFVEVDPDDPNTLEKFREVVRSRRFDGISIGWGLRSLPEMSWLFEAAVNVAREESPQSKLVFNAGPDDVLNAFRRQFPQLGNATQ